MIETVVPIYRGGLTVDAFSTCSHLEDAVERGHHLSPNATLLLLRLRLALARVRARKYTPTSDIYALALCMYTGPSFAFACLRIALPLYCFRFRSRFFASYTLSLYFLRFYGRCCLLLQRYTTLHDPSMFATVVAVVACPRRDSDCTSIFFDTFHHPLELPKYGVKAVSGHASQGSATWRDPMRAVVISSATRTSLSHSDCTTCDVCENSITGVWCRRSRCCVTASYACVRLYMLPRYLNASA